MAQGEEKLIGEFQGVRHKKQEGVLVITTARVAWSPGGQTFQVNHPYQQIKAQRISSETSSRIQLQLVLHTGTQVNFHFTEPNALEQRNQAKEFLSQQLSKASLKVNPELKAKTTLLNSDPSLYQLYKDLVGSGLITAEEFWSNRFSEENMTAIKGGKIGGPSDQQESGLPSAFLADVHAVSDGCNAVKYNLTVDVMQAIFKTYPSVRLKHAELVPDKMTEEAFWTQFFQSQFFHRETPTGKNMFSDCLTQEKKSVLESSKENGSKVTLNTTETSQHTLGEVGYSVAPEVQPTTSSALPLLQRCNHHSNMVLKAILDDKEPTTLGPDDSSSSLVTELKLSTSQQYHENSVPSTTLLSLAQEMTTWAPQQVVDSAAAHSALSCLLPGGLLMSAGGSNQKSGSSLSQEQRDSLFRHQAAIAELLRHFWNCFPVRTPQLEEKVNKMYQCLQDYQDSRLGELVTSLGGSDEHHVVAHMGQSITTALEQYHSWQAKRK